MKIVVAPYSEYDRKKEWPYYAELIKTLNNVTVLGSEKETGVNIPFCESIETIKNCDLFIGNDGGLYHIASYLGKRTIVIFMRHENIFRVGHFNLPNVKLMWRPTLDEVITNINHTT